MKCAPKIPGEVFDRERMSEIRARNLAGNWHSRLMDLLKRND